MHRSLGDTSPMRSQCLCCKDLSRTSEKKHLAIIWSSPQWTWVLVNDLLEISIFLRKTKYKLLVIWLSKRETRNAIQKSQYNVKLAMRHETRDSMWVCVFTSRLNSIIHHAFRNDTNPHWWMQYRSHRYISNSRGAIRIYQCMPINLQCRKGGPACMCIRSFPYMHSGTSGVDDNNDGV